MVSLGIVLPQKNPETSDSEKLKNIDIILNWKLSHLKREAPDSPFALVRGHQWCIISLRIEPIRCSPKHRREHHYR